MRCVIRVDIGGICGLGHVTRMRALAQALALQGAEVCFCTQTLGELQEYVAPFLCRTKEQERPQRGDVLIYDHPTDIPDLPCLMRLQQDGCKTVAIDHIPVDETGWDLCVLPNIHTPMVDLVRLNNLYGNRLLFGSDHVLFDAQVADLLAIPYSERITGPIVFCAGGSDPSRVLPRLSASLGWRNIPTDMRFLVGQHVLEPYILNMPPITPHVTERRKINQPAWREELRQAALVVTTMGIAVYECLYWQTPVLMVGHTTAHHAAGKELALHSECAWYLGNITSLGDAVLDMLPQFWHKWQMRIAMSASAEGLFDGQGTTRVAQAIAALA